MKQENILWLIAFFVCIFGVWFILRRNQGAELMTVPAADPDVGFYSPYYNTNPGISDDPAILNGGPTFNSPINVSINNPALGSLTNKYIPMFGFVGVTAVGAQ